MSACNSHATMGTPQIDRLRPLSEQSIEEDA